MHIHYDSFEGFNSVYGRLPKETAKFMLLKNSVHMIITPYYPVKPYIKEFCIWYC